MAANQSLQIITTEIARSLALLLLLLPHQFSLVGQPTLTLVVDSLKSEITLVSILVQFWSIQAILAQWVGFSSLLSLLQLTTLIIFGRYAIDHLLEPERRLIFLAQRAESTEAAAFLLSESLLFPQLTGSSGVKSRNLKIKRRRRRRGREWDQEKLKHSGKRP